jgi:hypothetical protein
VAIDKLLLFNREREINRQMLIEVSLVFFVLQVNKTVHIHNYLTNEKHATRLGEKSYKKASHLRNFSLVRWFNSYSAIRHKFIYGKSSAKKILGLRIVAFAVSLYDILCLSKLY